MLKKVKFYIKLEEKKIFYFDLDMTFTLMYDLDIHTKD